jgi:hypothetical protein
MTPRRSWLVWVAVIAALAAVFALATTAGRALMSSPPPPASDPIVPSPDAGPVLHRCSTPAVVYVAEVC